MSSNIVFKSNVYPAQSPILGDKDFISQVKDYDRLKDLKDSSVYSSVKPSFNAFQNKVIQEQPECSLAKGDPCYGLVYEDGKPKWKCKCVKKDCGGFYKCRPDFEEEEYLLFSPDVNSLEGYDYEFDFYEIKKYPVKGIDDVIGYETNDILYVQTDTDIECYDEVDIINIVEEEQKLQDYQPIDLRDEEVVDEITVKENAEDQVGDNEVNEKEDFDFLNDNMFDEFKEVTQDEIIEASANDMIFVDAGPGTGKTHTLINRINYLVTEQDIDPEYIVVVSFTNAAVAEVKERLEEYVLKGGSRGLRNVDKRTFHSLAWYIVNQANEDEELIEKGWIPVSLSLSERNYDLCIEAASKVIRNYPEFIDGWYIIVDEVQDLTGAKAVFVKMLINACIKNSTGVTIFGDYCQAIYDYTEKDNDGSIQFYKDSFRAIRPVGWFGRLEKNHRQIKELQDLTLEYRNAILNNDLEMMKNEVSRMGESVDEIEKTYLSIEQEDFNEYSISDSVCLMCRNNGQVLKLTSVLRKKGIDHMVNVYDRVQYFNRWIGDAFSNCESKEINESTFTEILLKKGYEEEKVSEIWRVLLKSTSRRSEYLNVGMILEELRTSKNDHPNFYVEKKHNLIVSNIHRAKGREYSAVILDKQFVNELYEKDHDIGEYKTLYVALTRPMNSIKSCTLSKPFEVKKYPKFGNGVKRWGSYKNGNFTHLEVLFEKDVNYYSFARNPIDYVDKYCIEIGDEIVLKRNIISEKNCKYDIYHIKNDVESIIGSMTDSFVIELRKYIRPEEMIDMPEYIDELYVDAIFSHITDTELFDSYEELKTKFKHPVWQCIDFRGLGHLKYDIY